MTDEQKDRYNRNIEKSQSYQNLLLNEDFLRFKEEQFEDVLTRCVQNVMWADVTDPQYWEKIKRDIIKFQTLQFALHESFSQKIEAAAEARKQLKKIQKTPEV